MPLFNNQTPNQPSQPEQLPTPQLNKPEPSAVAQPVTNKVTISSLLSGAVPSPASSANTNPTAAKNISQVQEKRFVDVKYKIYTLAIVTIGILLYGTVTDALSASWERWIQGNSIDTTIRTRIDSQAEYTTKTNLLKQIETNKDIIISCINLQEQCEKLPEDITKNLSAIKAYIQIGSLKRDKMDINEAKILKTINEFMTRTDVTSPERRYNGTVTNILIEDTKVLENNIVQVPVSLTVTFNNKENLISFISNIENNIFYTQTNGLNDSILYRIEELKYDIVNYRDTQDVEIALSAYAYNE